MFSQIRIERRIDNAVLRIGIFTSPYKFTYKKGKEELTANKWLDDYKAEKFLDIARSCSFDDITKRAFLSEDKEMTFITTSRTMRGSHTCLKKSFKMSNEPKEQLFFIRKYFKRIFIFKRNS